MCIGGSSTTSLCLSLYLRNHKKTAVTMAPPAIAQPIPIPAAVPGDTLVEDFGALADGEGIEVVPEVEVGEVAAVVIVALVLDIDDVMNDVLVAVKPEVIVKYVASSDGAGAANVSSVGE